MKGVFYLSVLIIALLGLIGCHTVPRHLVREEVIIQYYEVEIVENEPIGGPWPVPDPPYQPITNPGFDNPDPSRNSQTNTPNDGNSYGQRDPLKGGNHQGSGEIKSDPPVRIPKQNDREQ